MSVTAPDDAFLDVNDAHLRVFGNVHADGLKLGQLEVVTTTSTGSTIQFLHQHTAFTTTSNIEVGTTNHDLFVDTNTSRVGILTNTPTTALDVNGTVRATAFDGDGALLTGIPSSAINGTLSQWTTVTGPKIHYSDGNVGIGIADPLHTLDVVGDINFTGTLREDGNPFVSTPWTIETSPTALSYTGGNVGIGAATPSAKLEVTGNAHVTTDLSVGGTLSINTITAAATHALSAVTAVGASTGDTLQLTNATTGLVTTGNVEVGRDLSVTGNLTVLGTRTIVDTDTLRVKDPIIELGKDNPGTGDLGLVMTRPSGSSNVGIIFDESATTLEIGYTQGNASDSTITMDSAPLSVNVNGNVTITKNLEYGISPDRIQQHVTGGGKVFFGNPIQGSTPDYYFGNTITLDGTESTPTGPPDYLKWDQRVIPINFDLDNMYTTSGYVNITCPTSGTIDFINSLGTIQALTCTENGIPFDRGVWLALYYRWNPSGVEGTTMAVSGNDRGLVLVDYRYLPMNRTSKWILLAIVNSDVNSCKWLPGCTHIPRNMTYSASHPLLTYPYVFKNCVEISGAALGAGWYWFKDHNMTKPEYTYFDTVGWALAFSSKTYGNASFDLLNKGVGWNYLRVQSKDGTHMNRVWFASKQDYATRSSTSTSSTKSLYISGMRVYLGSAGGHGIYNTSQSVCNWSTAANAIGAGYDGSNCGSYPNNLVWGTGVGNSPSYTNITSGEVWEIWIYFE